MKQWVNIAGDCLADMRFALMKDDADDAMMPQLGRQARTGKPAIIV